MKNLNIDPYLCDECYYKIATYGYPCVLLMDLALAYYLSQEKLLISDKDIHDRIYKTPLIFLESKGFLISTEIDDQKLQILPNLSKCSHDRQKNWFCWC